MQYDDGGVHGGISQPGPGTPLWGQEARMIHPAGHWPPSGSGLQAGGAPPQLGRTQSSVLVHARAPHGTPPSPPPLPDAPPVPPPPSPAPLASVPALVEHARMSAGKANRNRTLGTRGTPASDMPAEHGLRSSC